MRHPTSSFGLIIRIELIQIKLFSAKHGKAVMLYESFAGLCEIIGLISLRSQPYVTAVDSALVGHKHAQ